MYFCIRGKGRRGRSDGEREWGGVYNVEKRDRIMGGKKRKTKVGEGGLVRTGGEDKGGKGGLGSEEEVRSKKTG